MLFPNPGTGQLTISATLPAPTPVAVELWDLLGRQVFHSETGLQPAGRWQTSLSLSLAAGVYLVQLRAGAHTARRLWICRP
jgi:hypothetical protein